MSAKTRSRGGRWAVLAVRAALVLVAGRLLLAAAVPFAVERIAHAKGFDVDWSRLRVHYLRGAFEVHDLAIGVRASDGGPRNAPFLRAESIEGDVAVRDLLGGDLRVQRAAAIGLDVVAERLADGSVPVLDAVLAAAARAKDEPPKRPEPIHFDLPVRVDALRVESLRLDVRDELAWGDQHWRAVVDVRGDDIGYPDRLGRIEVRASGPGWLESARIEIEVETHVEDAAVAVRAHLGGLRTETIGPWLAEIADMAGIAGLESDPTVNRLDGDFRFETRLRTDGSARDGIAGSLEIADARLATDGELCASIAGARVEVTSLRVTELRVATVDVHAGTIHARRDADGRPCAFGFRLADSAAQPATVATPTAPPTAPPTLRELRFHVMVGAVELSALSASLRDEASEPAVELRAVLERANVSNVDTRARRGEPIRIDARGSVDGIAAQIQLQGLTTPFADRKGAELSIDASGIHPTAIAPYLAELGLESRLENATFTAHLVGSGASTPTGGFEGDVRLADVKLADATQVSVVRVVEVLGLRFDPVHATFGVRDLTVRGMDLPLQRGADGSLAGLGLRTIPDRSLLRTADDLAAPVERAATPPTILPRVEIDHLAVVENRLSWRDESLDECVEVVLDDCGIEIQDLALFGDPAQHERSVATMKAWSPGKDVVKNVDASGSITTEPGPLDVELQLRVKLRGLTARRLQPYLDPTGVAQSLPEDATTGAITLHVRQDIRGLHVDLEARDFAFGGVERTSAGVELAFEPGAIELTPQARAELDPLVRQLRADPKRVVRLQHRFGTLDIARAEELSNPNPAECRRIADSLRGRRVELARERTERGDAWRAAWAAGRRDEVEVDTARLRALDEESEAVAAALDRVLALLKPGAEVLRDERTRAAAVDLARQRIETLRAWFATQDVPDLDERFEAKSPTFEASPNETTGTVRIVLCERQ